MGSLGAQIKAVHPTIMRAEVLAERPAREGRSGDISCDELVVSDPMDVELGLDMSDVASVGTARSSSRLEEPFVIGDMMSDCQIS